MTLRLTWQAAVDDDTLAADWILATELRVMERHTAVIRNVVTVLAVAAVAGLSARAGLPVTVALCSLLVGIPLLRFATSMLIALMPTERHRAVGIAALANSSLRPTTPRELTLTATDAGLQFSGALERALSWSEVEFCTTSPSGGLVLCLRERKAFALPRNAFSDRDAQAAFLEALNQYLESSRRRS